MLLAIYALSIGISTVAGSEDERKVVDGVEIYLGVLPVEMVRGHPKEHAESSIYSRLALGAEQSPYYTRYNRIAFNKGTSAC